MSALDTVVCAHLMSPDIQGIYLSYATLPGLPATTMNVDTITAVCTAFSVFSSDNFSFSLWLHPVSVVYQCLERFTVKCQPV